jgi:hypothetical protein
MSNEYKYFSNENYRTVKRAYSSDKRAIHYLKNKTSRIYRLEPGEFCVSEVLIWKACKYEGSLYHSHLFDLPKFKRTIKRAVPKIRKFRKSHPFDAIAFCGFSGGPIAGILSHRLSIPLIAVRKKGEKYHGCNPIGLTGADRYIIIDDLIASGDTIRWIKASIAKWSPNSKLVGIALFDDSCRDTYDGFPVLGL